jgi:hypothetical protein
MKVWIVGTAFPYEGSHVYGIYSTLERAKAQALLLGLDLDAEEYDTDFIQEYIVDSDEEIDF